MLINFNSVLNPTDAAFIRNAVKVVAFDSLSYWNFKVNPTADFNYTIGSGVNEAIFKYKPTMQGPRPLSNTFTWDFGDGISTTIVNPITATINHNYLSNGTYTVKLTVNNCNLTGTQQAIHQNTISFCNYNPTIFRKYAWQCQPMGDTISTQIYSAYQWYNGFGDVMLGKTNRKLPLQNTMNLYSVLTTQNGCSEMSQQYYNDTSPVILSNDVKVDGILIDANTVCYGNTLSLIATELTGSESVQWFKNGNPLTLGNNDTLIINSTGTYSLNVFHSNCPDYVFYSKSLAYTFINCVTGIFGKATLAFEIEISPIPTSNAITITSSQILNLIEIYNAVGEKIYSKIVNKKLDKEVIDLSSLSKGIYFIKMRDSRKVFTKKIIVE